MSKKIVDNKNSTFARLAAGGAALAIAGMLLTLALMPAASASGDGGQPEDAQTAPEPTPATTTPATSTPEPTPATTTPATPQDEGEIEVPSTPPYFPAVTSGYTFTQGRDIGAETLPEADGGAGGFTYSLSPAPPDGLSFDPASRALTGAPAAGGELAMTYTAADAEGAQVEWAFTIQVLRTAKAEAEYAVFTYPDSVNEDDGEFVVRFALAADSPVDMWVELMSDGGDAAYGDDFTITPSRTPTPAGKHLIIKGGSIDWTVTIVDDELVMDTEEIGFRLIRYKDGDDVTLSTPRVPIFDDDRAAVTVSDVSAVEGGDLVFTLVHEGQEVPGGFTVTPSYVGGTATRGVDYTANTTPLSFTGTAGEQRTFTVSTTQDAVVEWNETVRVSLGISVGPPGVSGGSATGTIRDDDSARVTSQPVSATEGEDLTFTVTLDNAVQGGLTVTPVFSDETGTDNTATEGEDYTANTAPLSFTGTAGEQRTFTVSTTRDEEAEGRERFKVSLDISDAPAGVSGSTTAGRIEDEGDEDPSEDEGATVTIADASAVEGSDLTFTATLNRAVEGGFTATPRFTDGTAIGGADYATTTTPLSFTGAAGEQRTFTVSTIQDGEKEAEETFTVSLVISDTDTGVVGSSAAGTIEGDDNAPPRLVGTIEDEAASMPLNRYVNLEDKFEDPDGDSLTFTAVSEHPAIVKATIVTHDDKKSVRAQPLAPGQSRITVTADDGFGGTASVSFLVTVGQRVERSVAENSPPGAKVGGPVTGTPLEGETLAYALDGEGPFAIDATTGQISVAEGAPLDHEGDPSHTARVRFTVGGRPAEIHVTIRVTDVDEPPAFTGGGSRVRAVAESAAAGSAVGAPVAAHDPEGDPLTYSLSGASDFDVDPATGQVKVSDDAVLNYEAAELHTVTVSVSDGKDAEGNEEAEPTIDDTAHVTINVTDVDEPPAKPDTPTVTRSETEPKPSLDVEWTAPVNTGRPDITGYRVQYREQGAADWDSVDLKKYGDGDGSNTIDTTLTGLKPDAIYQVRVAAVNHEGTGAWSDAAELRTEFFGVKVVGPAGPLTTNGRFAVTFTFPPYLKILGVIHVGYVNAARSSEKVGKDLSVAVNLSPRRPGTGSGPFNVIVTATRRDNPGDDGEGDGQVFEQGRYEVTVDPDAPRVKISGPEEAQNGPFEVTFSVSENDVGFDESDVAATNGSLDSFSGSGRSFTAQITPASVGPVVVEVPAGRLRDAAGHTNDAASYSVDIDVPTVAIGGLPATVRSREPVTVTFEFSVDVTGFEASDVTVENGGLGALTGSGSSYSAPVTADGAGDLTVTVAAHAASDAEGDAGPLYAVSQTARWSSFPAGEAAREIAESSPAAAAVGPPVAILNPGDDTVTYSLVRYGSNDADLFDIDSGTGQITVAAGTVLDHETKPRYTLAVRASVGLDLLISPVTIDVTDVDEPPAKPGAPTVERSSTAPTTTLDVSWTAPDNTGPPITGYTVRYREQGVAGWTEQAVAGAKTETVIDDLEPATTYEAQVAATNDEGTSDWSDAAAGGTLNPNPAPQPPGFESTGDRAVAENSPAGSPVGGRVATIDLNGDPLTYSLSASDAFVIDPATGQIGVAEDAALDHEAAPSHTVTVSVTDGKDADGKAEAKPTIDATLEVTINVTDVDEPPAKPDAPTVEPASAHPHSRLDVSWTAPANTGPAITDYDVWYRVQDATEWSPHAFTGTGTTTTISVLESDAAYEVRVAAANDEGTGGWSDPGTGRTEIGYIIVEGPEGPLTTLETFQVRITYPRPEAMQKYGLLISGAAAGRRVCTLWNTVDGPECIHDITPQRPGTGSGPFVVHITVGWEDLSGRYEVTVDPEPPTVSIGGVPATIGSLEPLTVTFDFSEDVTGFDASDVTVENGILGTLTESGAAYSAPVTPDGNGDLTVTVAADAAQDGAGSTGPAEAVSQTAALPSREIAENSPGGAPVGALVTADLGPTPVHSLQGSALFDIDSATGQIRVAKGAALDHEATASYTVTVTVTNDHLVSSVTRSILVTINVTDVDEPPAKPDAPTVEPASDAPHTSLDVSWTAPANFGPAITDYDVRYRVRDSGGGFTDAEYDGTGTKTTISGLESGTTYEVQVAAANDEGTGGWSDAGTGRTDLTSIPRTPNPITGPPDPDDPGGDEPPARPGAPAVEQSSANPDSELDVSWTAAGAAGVPATTDYDVRYRVQGAKSWTDHDFDGAVPGTAVGGLEPGAVYEVQVLARNDEGESPWSESGTGVTGPARLSANREVPEDAESGDPVGEPVTADDPQGHTLTYSIIEDDVEGATGQANSGIAAKGGAGRSTGGQQGGGHNHFTIDTATGQISVADGAALDYETTHKHVLTVEASHAEPGHPDDIIDAVITVIVEVTDVDEASDSPAPGGPPPRDPRPATPPVDDNDAPSFTSGPAVREAPEDSPAGSPVGGPVTAADPEGDPLTYSLSGGDGAFDIDPTTGQISVADGAQLDYEATPSYTVTVGVTDGKNADGNADSAIDDTVEVTINVTDVDEPPAKPAPGNPGGGGGGGNPGGGGGNPGGGSGNPSGGNDSPNFGRGSGNAREVAENAPAGSPVGGPVTAADPDGDPLTYSLSGSDAFVIDPATGQIRVADGAQLDYEATPSYTVTVGVTDGKNADGNVDPAVDATAEVTISVIDMDEPPARPDAPSVSPSSTAPANTGPPITGYDVRYRKEGAEDWMDHAFDGTATATAISGLESDTAYEVQVAAANDEGAGDWSDSGTGSTEKHERRDVPGPAPAPSPAPAPTTPPRDSNSPASFGRSSIREVAENAPAGSPVGDPAAATDPDGDPLTYSISGPNAFDIDPATGQIMVAEGASLDHETTESYTVTVSVTDGKNADGNAEAVPAVDATAEMTINVIDVDEPPASPDAPSVSPSSTAPKTALDATWAAPANTGPAITGYGVRYRERGEPEWTDHAFTGAGTSTAIEDLESDTTYEVQVAAANDEGTGPWSDAGTGSTESMEAQTVPGPAPTRTPPPPSGSNGRGSFGGPSIREVAENAPAGSPVGDPVAAADPDGDPLTYSLSGSDAFVIDPATGQISVAERAALDHEAAPSYTVTVSVTDGKNADGSADPAVDAVITVVIDVIDVDEPPDGLPPGFPPPSDPRPTPLRAICRRATRGRPPRPPMTTTLRVSPAAPRSERRPKTRRPAAPSATRPPRRTRTATR